MDASGWVTQWSVNWTSPIVLGAFLAISIFLAALNVPLSAYSVVQEFTYRPNDTLPAVALSSLVPSFFQQSTVTTPQLLTVGDIIRLNGSVFNYTVVDIFDGVDQTNPVSSFLYYNSLFSDGCDVRPIFSDWYGGPPLPALLILSSHKEIRAPWRDEMMEMRHTLDHMRLLLEKYGIVDDTADKGTLRKRSNEGVFSPLVFRASASSDSNIPAMT
ncbi:hypothetical protein B0H14DRAFT_3617546 [Mycena olivaceomarginata]|nr:hypothetical protein B0H14DRAFT_3617546 [Mycena olivaceomarginata]